MNRLRHLGLAWICTCLLQCGCSMAPVDLDSWICTRAEQPVDQHVQPLPKLPPPRPEPKHDAELQPAQFNLPQQNAGRPTLSDRLKMPAGIPGEHKPDIRLPGPTATPLQRQKAFDKYFPPLPAIRELPEPPPNPQGKAYSLEELQRIAKTNSPLLRQAVADVEAARGAAQQAGLYPNPTIGAIHQGKGPGGGPTSGGFVGQTLKFPGKLRLAQKAALLEMKLTEYRLRQTEVDLQSKVRAGYFSVLVAREKLRATRAMAKLTDEIVQVMLVQLKQGLVATYEPMQMRVLALDARGFVVQAHNRYLSAWKQLASAMGVPGMPLTELEGRADMPMPRYHYDTVLSYVLNNHTEVLSALTSVQKADRELGLAKLTPYPDADVQVAIVRDNSPPGPAATVTMFQAGFPVPVFNRNQGKIYETQANLASANQLALKARTSLTTQLAQAFESYENNRVLIELYSKQILPTQVLAFRAAVARHSAGNQQAGVSYNDLVTAEQNLVGRVNNYITILGDTWTSVVDIAQIMQTDDLFQTNETITPCPVPDLSQLLPVGEIPHCSPVQDPALHSADGYWPAATSDSKKK